MQTIIRRFLRESVKLAALMLATSFAGFGQAEPNQTAPIPPKVYIAEFKPSGASKTDLNQFARQLFKLRLLAVPGVYIAEDSETPPCGDRQSALAESYATEPTGLADRNPPPSSVPAFYRVQGSFDAQGGAAAENQSSILATYELVKAKNCGTTLLFRRTRTFSLADALQNLEEAAEELSLQLSDDLAAKAAVQVDTVEVLGDPKGTYRAGDLLTRFVRQRVADADALCLWDNTSRVRPTYTLKGRVQFSNLGSSGVRAQVRFLVNGEPLLVNLPPQAIKPPSSEAMIPFYLDASSAAVKGLLDLLYKERAGLNQISPQEPDTLVRKARQLLCVEPTTDSQKCSPDPQAALLALNEAQQRPGLGNPGEVMALIGRANFQGQQYLAAADAYDKSLKTTGLRNDEARLELLKNAGDAWYEAKEYGKAADRYGEYVRQVAAANSVPSPMRLQPEVRVKLVHSLLLAERRREALEALLDNLKAAHNWPNPDTSSERLYRSLSSELGRVLDGFPTNELELAVEKLESGLAYDPALEASALKQISRAYDRAGRYEEAIAGYRKTLSLKSDDADAHFKLAFALNRKGQTSAAIAEYRETLRLNPEDALAHNNLGAALNNEGQHDDAIAEFRAALKLNPDYATARNNLAAELTGKGQYEEAERLYRQAIESQPSDTRAYYQLWWLYRRQTKHDLAKEVFNDLQKVAPAGDPNAQLMLARVREDNEDFSGAAEIYAKLHQQDPEEPYYVVVQAEAEIQAGMKNHDLGLVQKGVHRLEQEVTKNPSFDTYLDLAWAHVVVPELRDADKAAELYRKALTYRPDDIRARQGLTDVKLIQGDFQATINESREALKLNPRDPDVLEDLAYAEFLTGNLRGALESYELALKVTKDDPVLRTYYGEALFWSANSTRAHEEFAHARELLSHPGPSGATWIGFIEDRYDATEKRRVMYYSTIRQKQALVELFDGLTYLREVKISAALERYRAATAFLTTSAEDKEVARKAINDLQRLGKESIEQHTAEIGLGCLYDWLGETERAAKHWELYFKSGTDPVGLEEARRRLARETK